MHYDCLIVDDEPAIAESTSEYFNLFGVSCAHVANCGQCLTFMKEHSVSLMLLDINLDGDSGFSLCKTLREKTDIPILFISARTSDDDILTALNIGGDDYITKPYTLNILLAKVKAVLKRCCSDKVAPTLQIGKVEIDIGAHRVLVRGMPVHFKEMEFRLLVYLSQNLNRVIPKEELLENVWPDPFVGEGTLSVHIRHLREKVERDPNHPELIQTVWGIGYRMEAVK